MAISKKAGIIAGSAVAALAVAGIATATMASAAGGSARGDDSRPGVSRLAEEPVTGADADKVRAAVLAKYPGATINKMEKDANEGSVFEAYITKTDGSRAKILLDADFQITAEKAPQGRGMHQHGPGRHGADQGVAEEPVTGADADKVRAAVLAKYPGATINKMEKDANEGSVFEAYITKTDGSRAKILLDADFQITAEKAPQGRGMHQHGEDSQGPEA